MKYYIIVRSVQNSRLPEKSVCYLTENLSEEVYGRLLEYYQNMSEHVAIVIAHGVM